MQTAKTWFQSKTIWLNIASGIIAIVGMLNVDVLKTLGVGNPERIVSVFAIVVGALNIILRMGNPSPILPVDQVKNNK